VDGVTLACDSGRRRVMLAGTMEVDLSVVSQVPIEMSPSDQVSPLNGPVPVRWCVLEMGLSVVNQVLR
jgi:hypothetical protein